MKRSGAVRAAAGLILFIASLLFASRMTARAYSIYDTSTASTSGSFQGLLSPFENFFRSMNSVNTTGVTVPIPTETVPDVLKMTGKDAWSRFDNWFYGIAKFHLGDFLTQILTIWSWILGTIKSGIDSLLKIFGK